MVRLTFGIGIQVLLTLLIVSGQAIESMVQSASIETSDYVHAQKSDWLVQELNGAHLRFTIVVVS